MAVDVSQGEAFDDVDVAAAYAFRPPYPDVLYDVLTRLPARQQRLLDIGCGTGKIAHSLATYFQLVDGVDPSEPMLDIAHDGQHANIRWIRARAEHAPLVGQYDLITAGASIHWMDHMRLFPRLFSVMAPGGVLAVVEGDDVDDAPWKSDWLEFVERWLATLGKTFDPEAYQSSMKSYKRWLDIAGEETFLVTITQEVEHFITCQHSRATWSRRNLGDCLTDRFDAEIRSLLTPYASQGLIQYLMKTQLSWGAPRTRSKLS